MVFYIHVSGLTQNFQHAVLEDERERLTYCASCGVCEAVCGQLSQVALRPLATEQVIILTVFCLAQATAKPTASNPYSRSMTFQIYSLTNR